jgi:drug/metabolite transporter, DME family
LVLAAAVLWGTTGTAQALAPVGVQPVVIGAARLAVGGLALLLVAGMNGRLTNRRPLPFRPALLGAAAIAAYQLCFFAAVSLTGVAAGTIVAIGSAPILAGLLSWAVERERPSRRWVVATMLAVTGCALLVGSGGTLSVNGGGVLLALGAGAAYAVYAHASKALLARQQPPDYVTAVLFCLGAIFLLPVLLLGDLSGLVTGRGLLVALHLGLVATALAYILFTRGLQRVPVSSAVTLSLAEPLTAALLGIFLLGEQLALTGLLGMSILLSGLFYLLASGLKRV